jgi:hypothetical protein
MLIKDFTIKKPRAMSRTPKPQEMIGGFGYDYILKKHFGKARKLVCTCKFL